MSTKLLDYQELSEAREERKLHLSDHEVEDILRGQQRPLHDSAHRQAGGGKTHLPPTDIYRFAISCI